MRVKTLHSELLPAFFIEGNIEAADLEWIYERSSSDKTILEIRCFKGKTTFAWLAGGANKVISLDACDGRWDAAVNHEMLSVNLCRFCEKWEWIPDDGQREAAIYASLNGKPPDIIFINVELSGDRIESDLDLALRICPMHGLICGTGFPYMPAHLARWFSAWENFAHSIWTAQALSH
jgi:hypothetical protein